MNHDEQPDRLNETSQRGEGRLSDVSDEVLVRLAVAGMLTQYQDIDVPQAMAERIEKLVRAHIRQQAPASAPTRLRSLIRHATPSGRRRRTWRTLLSVAALLLLLLCIGTFTAAAHTLPGDPLYGVKQAENQFALFFANSPSTRAENTIGQLRNALNDLQTVAAAGRDSGVIQQTLDVVIAQTKSSQAAVAAVPAGPARDKARQDLASVLATEDQVLRALLDNVNWSTRVMFTLQLGVIGQAVPTIKQVSVSQQSGGILVVTVTGTNFTQQARLVINGQPQGMFSQQTATRLVGNMSQNNWRDDAQMVGVLNPDGTATQMQVVFHSSDDHGGRGGPGSGGTPTSGDDHGGSGKGGSGGKGSDG